MANTGGIFSGTSQNGNFNEALTEAIGLAKQSLTTDFVTWRLLETTGENGGFRHKNELTVTIRARGPEAEAEEVTQQ